MEKTVAALARAERDVLPHRGAAFLLGDGGQVLFRFVIDTANVIGPRPATDADRAKYPGEWTQYQLANPPPPLGEESPPAGAAEDFIPPTPEPSANENSDRPSEKPARTARKR